MKLWLMFASAYEEDLKTSEACLGGLAGVCHEKDIAKAIEVSYVNCALRSMLSMKLTRNF